MAVTVEPPPDQHEPSAGVIQDARARQSRRRRFAAAALVVLAAAGVLAAVLGGSGGHGRETARARELRGALSRLGRVAHPIGQISPALEGGSYGWEIKAATPGSLGIGGSCCTLPSVNLHTRGPWVGVVTGSMSSAHVDSLIAMLPNRVQGFLSRNGRGRMITLGRLPYGMRLAAVSFTRRAKPLLVEGSPRGLLALDAHGRPLGYMQNPEGFGGGDGWWQSPHRPTPGPCAIKASGLPGLEPQWGHVAQDIRPYPRRIIGRAFLSCSDTDYNLHHWPLTAAILLDAQHPGVRPAPIPNMHPVSGAPGVFEAPRDWHGELTAVRSRDAWLVVAGGSGPAQRLQVLRHVHAVISARR